MKKLLLGTFSFSLLLTTNILSMQNEKAVTVDDNTEITIVSVDNNEIKQPYSIFKQSATLKNLIDDEQINGIVEKHIPVPNVLGKDWNTIINLLNNQNNIEAMLTIKTIQELATIINCVNYLDIPSIMDLAIKVIASKIKASENLICNTNSIAKIASENAKKLCESAIKIDLPWHVEKQIVQKIAPQISIKKNIDIMSYFKKNNIIDLGTNFRLDFIFDEALIEGKKFPEELSPQEEIVKNYILPCTHSNTNNRKYKTFFSKKSYTQEKEDVCLNDNIITERIYNFTVTVGEKQFIIQLIERNSRKNDEYQQDTIVRGLKIIYNNQTVYNLDNLPHGSGYILLLKTNIQNQFILVKDNYYTGDLLTLSPFSTIIETQILLKEQTK